MPYRYLEDIAIADIAFEASGQTIEELFVTSADALANAMVADLGSIAAQEYREFQIEDQEIDLLLFQMLQEFIFLKDAERLLLRAQTVQLTQNEKGWTAIVKTAGEYIDPLRHDLIVDVKAVTLYRLKVNRGMNGWNATVVLDV
jgi:SHS2 domain-containing protein